ILIHHSLCEKHSKLSLHFFWVRSDTINYKKISPIVHIASIALFTIIRTDHNMLLLYHSHKHISYPIRTIARSAINSQNEDYYFYYRCIYGWKIKFGSYIRFKAFYA
ncbi:hypothetical protein OZD68_00900, partial [Wolbachia endosymbiont of Drosophila bicornuta]